MTRLLDGLARVVTRLPALALSLLLAATIGFGAATTLLEVDTGVENFAPSGGRADTLDEIERRFSTTTSVQVVIDAGPGGNLITPQAVADVEALADAIEAHPDVEAALAPPAIDQPPVVSFALPFSAAGEMLDRPVEDLDRATFQALATGILEDGGDEVAGLFSDDLRVDPPEARAGLLVVDLAASADRPTREAAARAIGDLVDTTDIADARRSTMSMLAIEEGIEDALERDLPVLLSVALLLVVVVLAWLFRSVVDVAVGLTGLLASIVWMVGIAALLGPAGAGLVGPFNQVSIAVPVLLVGLGIDYSVHLTTRYREQRRCGDDAVRAARVATATVGVALVLATMASVAGFLANLVTPLPPIRDFGIFAAVGIVSAFVILSTAVPAARALVDRRADRRRGEAAFVGTVGEASMAEGDGAPGRDGDAGQGDSVTPRWARAIVAVATRHPLKSLASTAGLLALAAIAASGLSTEFDERDFLPEGEPVLATIDRLEARFGGDVSERTHVLVDGDLDHPALLGAVASFEEELPSVDDVRTAGGDAERRSPLELRDRVVERGRGVRERIADDLRTWHDPRAAAEDVALPEPLDVEAFLDDLDDGDLPEELRDALGPRLPEGRDPLVAMLRTTDPDELEATIREELAAGFEEDRPEELADEALGELAGLEPAELTLGRLEAAGFPLDELSDTERERLRQLEALEDAGPVDATDGEVLRRHLDVLEETAETDLARVMDDDGMLISISTQGGQTDAEVLATALQDLAEPIAASGGTVSVVSDPLVNAEIIEELSAAQLTAIAISLAAAAALLMIATFASSRVVGLGLIGIVPSVVALVLVLGAMRGVGLAFNALTATVASIAVGIGVPYGIHLTNRYREGFSRGLGPEGAAEDALTNTGPALIGSAATTGLAFAVLMLSNSVPIQQFGIVSTMMIVFALLGCLLVQPALLVLWGRRRNVTGGWARGRNRGKRAADERAGEPASVA